MMEAVATEITAKVENGAFIESDDRIKSDEGCELWFC